jgi:hypothetical protein
VSNADPAVIERVEAVIREQLVPPRSLRETRSLASIGHRILRYLPSSLEGLSEAAAAASVRAAALTAGNDALQLLRSYARDPRKGVQAQLAQAWEYFEPAQFAATVLADSPLDNGTVSIAASRLLPHVHRLRKLTDLEIRLDTERHRDLSWLEGAPGLQSVGVTFDTDATVDLRPLTKHKRLKYVLLFFAHRYSNVRHLSRLNSLRNLTLFCETPWRNLNALAGLPIRFLALNAVYTIENLDALDSLENLKNLNLWECTPQLIARSAPLNRVIYVGLHFDKDERFTEVDMKLIAEKFPNATEITLGYPIIKNAHELSRLPLSELTIYYTPAIDLSFVATLPGIRRLVLEQVSEPVDLAPLADLTITVDLIDTAHRGTEKLGPGVRLI